MSSGKWRPFCFGLNVLKPIVSRTNHRQLLHYFTLSRQTSVAVNCSLQHKVCNVTKLKSFSCAQVDAEHGRHNYFVPDNNNELVPIRRHDSIVRTLFLIMNAFCVGGFPSQGASKAESVSMSWRHHALWQTNPNNACLFHGIHFVT